MKLAFVVSLYFEYGGMQRTMLRIAQNCVARGHQVDIYTGGWQGEHPQDINVIELDTQASTNVKSNDVLAEKFHAAVSKQQYDCLVGFTKLPGLDVYYAGDPCYAARVEYSRPFWYKWTPRYRGFRRQEAAVFAKGLNTQIMLIAHQEKAKFQHYYKTEELRFHLLPPGINVERFAQLPKGDDRRALRAELNISLYENFILLVGSRFKTKGLDRALIAFAALPDELRNTSKLVVVGGDKQGPYIKQAKQLGIAEQLVFTGARDDLVRFYATADALVHPAYSENTGTILIEAMLCGLPQVASGACGFAYHVIEAEAGLITPEPFKQSVFNEQLVKILTSGERVDWHRKGPQYCQRTDLYSLIDHATDVVIARALRNREAL